MTTDFPDLPDTWEIHYPATAIHQYAEGDLIRWFRTADDSRDSAPIREIVAVDLNLSGGRVALVGITVVHDGDEEETTYDLEALRNAILVRP